MLAPLFEVSPKFELTFIPLRGFIEEKHHILCVIHLKLLLHCLSSLKREASELKNLHQLDARYASDLAGQHSVVGPSFCEGLCYLKHSSHTAQHPVEI